MCGIAGAFGVAGEARLDAMLDAIYHRGPDESGSHVDRDAGLAMGIRRLSIIDIESGSQPIYNEDDTVAVVFNGEIYNYPALRERLEARGHRFETDCDTEVLVHLWEEYGERTPDHLNGMFAFAIWDREAESLFLARDRLGIKPLYYVDDGEGVRWASELRALLAAGADRTLDERAVSNYFTLRYWAWPQTPFEAVEKLEPGTSLLVTREGRSRREFWRLENDPETGSLDALADRFRTMIEESVEKRLMSDVPIGAFLSGGLDSSTIVALMSEMKADPVRTFSIGFEDQSYDESSEAAFVADHFGTDHHEITVDLSSMDLFGDVIEYFGEPLADPAVLPTLAISRYASEEVTVVLSGEGADELLGGYWYFKEIPRHMRRFDWLPPGAFRLAGKLSRHTPVRRQTMQYFSALESTETAIEGVAQRFQVPADTYTDLDYSSEETGLAEMVRDTAAYVDGTSTDRQEEFYKRMLAFDLTYWLPDDLLYKVDGTSMSTSLEARVPFLDHNIVEFAYNVPAEHKMGGYKPVLKRAVSDLLPERTLSRDKHGLGVPVSEWFRSDHEAIARWLTADRVDATPYLDADAVFDVWETHRRGRHDRGLTLWKILNFVAWYHTIVRRTDGRQFATCPA